MKKRLIQPLLLMALIAAACGPAATPEPALPAPALSTQPAPAAQPTRAEPTAVIPPTSPQPTPTTAPESPTEVPVAAATISGRFDKGEVAVAGSFTLDPATNVLSFSDDFKISPGPDLYVILSGADDVTLDFQSFSQVVTERPILYLGTLISASGAQAYTIPAGTDLAPYKTVVIWCKQYRVEFAAAKLTP